MSWDVDGDGTICENEIIKPLVSLGLAPDEAFAQKICRALEPKNSKRKSGQPLELSLDDFVSIFKNDKISE